MIDLTKYTTNETTYDIDRAFTDSLTQLIAEVLSLKMNIFDIMRKLEECRYAMLESIEIPSFQGKYSALKRVLAVRGKGRDAIEEALLPQN